MQSEDPDTLLKVVVITRRFIIAADENNRRHRIEIRDMSDINLSKGDTITLDNFYRIGRPDTQTESAG